MDDRKLELLMKHLALEYVYSGSEEGMLHDLVHGTSEVTLRVQPYLVMGDQMYPVSSPFKIFCELLQFLGRRIPGDRYDADGRVQVFSAVINEFNGLIGNFLAEWMGLAEEDEITLMHDSFRRVGCICCTSGSDLRYYQVTNLFAGIDLDGEAVRQKEFNNETIDDVVDLLAKLCPDEPITTEKELRE